MRLPSLHGGSLRGVSLRGGLVVALAFCSTAALPACDGPSQLIVGVVTNLRVRGQLSKVRLEAYRNDVLADQQYWDVSDQTGTDFVLPGSFTYFSDKGGSPVVDIRLAGFIGNSLTPVVERSTQVRLTSNEQRFYRMSLVLACGKGEPNAVCPDGLGCVEGICKPIPINEKTLLPFSPDRVSTIECDSGSKYIDTGTCSSGTCALLPIASAGCKPGEFCSEGTCYQRDPADVRRLEFGEQCSSVDGDVCRETGYQCAATPSNLKQRCRQTCQTAADCTRRLPDAVAQGIAATVAACAPSGGGLKTCTYACDPVNVSNSGCLSGTRCLVTTDSQQFIASDCVPASSTGGTLPIGAMCNTNNGSDDCTPGSSCIQKMNDPAPTCLKNCFLGDASTCPAPTACHATATPAGTMSARYGVCF